MKLGLSFDAPADANEWKGLTGRLTSDGPRETRQPFIRRVSLVSTFTSSQVFSRAMNGKYVSRGDGVSRRSGGEAKNAGIVTHGRHTKASR